MQKVKLITRAGGYVTTVLVPPFNPPAEGIIWGSRSFFLDTADVRPEGYLVYREGLVFYATEEAR